MPVLISPAVQNYVETIPSRHMLRWAEQMWRFTAPAAGSSIILPDARSDIMFRYRLAGRRLDGLVPIVTSPATQPFTVEYQPGDCWIGVRLKPEHTAGLQQLSSDLIRVGTLRGASANELLNKLGLDASALEFELQLEDALHNVLNGLPDTNLLPWLKSAIDRFHLTGGRTKISTVADAFGISVRQLHRGFLKHVGVSPKDYGAIIRFHRSLRLLQKSDIGIADVAFESGYADQSHMTREYARFGGFTPKRIPDILSLPGLPI